jgi:uncharacterized protein (DUF2236 family)
VGIAGIMSSGPLARTRRSIAAAIEEVGGRHDEPSIYGGEPGDPGLAGGPGAMAGQIHGDLASVVAAGPGAVIMEVLEPSVMAGVDQRSSYRTQPIRRAQNTLGYVLRTTFGSTEAATAVIDRVRGIHGRISGTRPDGVPYRALDPELIAWVHTCIPWAVMTAYERVGRPLTVAEKDRYLAEQAVIGRMGGADRVPETVAELDEYVEHMRPRMAMTETTRGFVDFLLGTAADSPAASTADLVEGWASVHTSMMLMPGWARRLTGTHHSTAVDRLVLEPALRLRARAVRWAYPELPCRRMALARVAGAPCPLPKLRS